MAKENIVAVFGNGEAPDKAFISPFVAETSVVIAADGGIRNCLKAGRAPDYIVGDMDSGGTEKSADSPKSVLIHRTDQDRTDIQKALDFALTLDPSRIRIFSAMGKRSDHALGNILILQSWTASIPIELYDNFGFMYMIRPGSHIITGRSGDTVSLFSTGPVAGLTLRGFRFPLQSADFNPSFLGISNQLAEPSAHIEFTAGSLFVYRALRV